MQLKTQRDRDSRERRDDRDNRLPRRADYHERVRSPAVDPPPARERERERDYKRSRNSPSPPPYVPRDRRYSSPSKRSPPYKRSRRDDPYDGRHGSPRAVFNADERRFGYDNGGAYDRAEIGGRAGYIDERSHGRHLARASGGFPSGPPDWSGSGRTGFINGANMMGTPQREGLMTYKQFISELEDDILLGEAERRYEEYRTKYITTQKCAFFEAHKDEEWLRDKYDPSHLEAVI